MNKYSDYDQAYKKKHGDRVTIRSAIFFTIAVLSFMGFVYVVSL